MRLLITFAGKFPPSDLPLIFQMLNLNLYSRRVCSYILWSFRYVLYDLHTVRWGLRTVPLQPLPFQCKPLNITGAQLNYGATPLTRNNHKLNLHQSKIGAAAIKGGAWLLMS